MRVHTLPKLAIFALLLGACFGALQLVPGRASAAYEGGRIIDNSVFLDANSMSAGEIQDFLEKRGSGLKSKKMRLNCDKWDAQTRQGYTDAGAPCGSRISAARIIHYASHIYGMNPRVVLATLQKEQSLITSPDPTNWQLTQAMGYGCPTSGNCEDGSTFSYQIDNGTWALRYHYERANRNFDWWSPSSSWVCGSSKKYYKPSLYPYQDVRFYDGNNVNYRKHYLHNAATSAMYCYTPHAYNNPNGLYGLPEYGSKGQYYTGSYNFVKSFELWFGSTKGDTLEITRNLQFSPLKPSKGDTVSASFMVKNDERQPITIDALVVAARDDNGNNVNFPGVYDLTLDPGESYTYHESRSFSNPGKHTIWIAAKLPSGDWSKNWPLSSSKYIRRERSFTVYPKPDIKLIRNLYYSPTNLTAGDTVSASFIVRNDEANTVKLDEIRVITHDANGRRHDFPSVKDVSIGPGQQLKYYKRRVLNGSGSYRLSIEARLPSGAWSRTWPVSSSGSIVRQRNITVQPVPDISVTRDLYFSPKSPLKGQLTSASFKIRNNESSSVTIPSLVVAARNKNGTNVNFPAVYNLTLNPGEIYTYYERRTFGSIGEHNIWIAAKFPSGRWSTSWPYSSSGIQTRRTFDVRP